MKQEAPKPKPKRIPRIGRLIPVLIVFSLALCIILTLLGPVVSNSVQNPAPVVTPAHSAQELWDNPLPTPEWITDVPTIYNEPSDSIFERNLCLNTAIDELWDWDAGFAHPFDVLRTTTGITVDGAAIYYGDIVIIPDYFFGELGCDVHYPGETLPKIAGVTGGGLRISPASVDLLTISSKPILGSGNHYDDNGCPINFINRICFNTPTLEPGLHTATIRIENNAGVPYTYEWAFRVE